MNKSLSHTNKDDRIKISILSFIVATANVAKKDSGNNNRLEATNNLPESMMLTPAELDHRKSTAITKDDAGFEENPMDLLQ